jgi:hypothetical protein
MLLGADRRLSARPQSFGIPVQWPNVRTTRALGVPVDADLS